METSESQDQNEEDNLTTQDIHEYQTDIQPLIITSHGTEKNRGSLSLDVCIINIGHTSYIYICYINTHTHTHTYIHTHVLIYIL